MKAQDKAKDFKERDYQGAVYIDKVDGKYDGQKRKKTEKRKNQARRIGFVQ